MGRSDWGEPLPPSPPPGEGFSGLEEIDLDAEIGGGGNRCYGIAGRVTEHPMTNETNYVAKSVIVEN